MSGMKSLHTLSQIFLEIFDAKISPYSIHLQLYTYSDLIGDAVRKSVGNVSGEKLDFLAAQMEQTAGRHFRLPALESLLQQLLPR